MCSLFKELENYILLEININCFFHPLQTPFFPRQRKGKGDETRGGEGWSGDWNYGTMEGGGLAVGAGDDNIRLALARPPPLLPPLSHTL